MNPEQQEVKDAVALTAARVLLEAVSTSVQSLILSQERFKSEEAALSWAKKHKFGTSKIHKTGESFRIRQFDAGECQEDSIRTIQITDGVSSTVCRRKT